MKNKKQFWIISMINIGYNMTLGEKGGTKHKTLLFRYGRSKLRVRSSNIFRGY